MFDTNKVVITWVSFVQYQKYFPCFSLFVASAVAQTCSVKKLFLEIFENSQENTCARVSCLMKLHALFKKILWYRCFLVNYVKFLRTSFLTEHLWWLLLCCQLTILTGKNYKNSSIQEFVKLYSWLLLIFVYTTN